MMIAKSSRTRLTIILVALGLIPILIFKKTSSREIGFINRVGPENLIEFRNESKHDYDTGKNVIEKSDLPKSWGRMHYKGVYTPEGVKIKLKEGQKYETGIFISWLGIQPSGGSGIGFKSVEKDIYTFKEKIRVRAINNR